MKTLQTFVDSSTDVTTAAAAGRTGDKFHCAVMSPISPDVPCPVPGVPPVPHGHIVCQPHAPNTGHCDNQHHA